MFWLLVLLAITAVSFAKLGALIVLGRFSALPQLRRLC